ncbi:MAG: hypothetical protein MUP66_03245 [Candidatus Nanohaloarchaeota archaeon QJJ-5]|nr:hypothetical protein [Candidatus Nanohaloarchaeota archaeon QJJ-5]
MEWLIAWSFVLVFAAINIFLMYIIMQEFMTVAEAPRAWSFACIGMSFVVIHLSLNLFIWQGFLTHTIYQPISATFSATGFLFLFLSSFTVWRVVSE